MEAIFKQLRKARIAAGLTQAALAGQVGCTQSAVSMMEAGRPEALSRESLEKLAKVLNVTLPEAVDVYDTTLRDGSQLEGISLTVDDKLRIAEQLDHL